MTHRAGPHFLQIPGPSNVPGRILRAIERWLGPYLNYDRAE